MSLAVQERSNHAALVGFVDLDERIAAALGPRAEAFRAYRRDWKRGAVPRPFPLQLDVELNRSCNLRCPMCTWSDPDAVNGAKGDWMPLERFRTIVTEGVPQGLRAVNLNGVNEPLLRPDLPEFVRAAREAGVLDVMLHTNGMLLTRRMAHALIDAGLTRLMVSIDAATPATYDRIRVGGDLDRVRRNVQQFLDGRGDAVLPVLGVCFVETALNADELDLFMTEWRGRADFFSIQSFINPWPGRPDKDALAATGTRAPREFRCAQPFMRMSVRHDGAMSGCCTFWGTKMTVGHIADGVQAAWNGPTMASLRETHAAGRWSDNPICRECVTHSFTEIV